ncbi:T9SS sorting signal type C domain-containing protein [Flavobacterium sp. IB48]|uniref:T9SS sorting signal type C domain-containing protein n=1 Tax=Flavobacterium sp. IB48 TaxID=2779375 RepID=UPI0018E81D2E|nr:T9SS sorting signal type C domain-containing protein [Flavobacterium sp. IB48]MBJ2123764.1 T9SS sorting signal type C domain-containing protein [Flavobacterium sp. IB48]
MIKNIFYLLIIISISLRTVSAQQGKIDNSFNILDDGQNGDGFDSTVRTLLMQKDGTLLVGGDFLRLNGTAVSYLTRLNTDGSIDESFNTGTGFNGKIYSSCLQSDGKIIIGGNFTSYNGISAGRIIRLNQDGSYDPTFNTTIGATSGIVYDIALQSDGKIIIVGSFTNYNSSKINRVARLLPNGSLDSTFLIGSGSLLNVTQVKILADEKILLTGNFTIFNTISANRIIRLNANGTFDSSFNCGAGFDNDVNTIALQPDGKIVLGGNFTSFNNITANRIIRLNEDGIRDESFVSGSGFSKEAVETIKINKNGEIMVGGSFTGFYNTNEVVRLILLEPDGSIKPNFDIGSGPATASVFALEFDEEGAWFVGGSFSVFNGLNQGRLVKISNEGEHDISYLASGIGFDNSVFSILPLPNRKTIIGGNFKKFNGNVASKITCLLENGTTDLTFNATNSGSNNAVKATILQLDGKIILGGNFTKYNDFTNNRIVRIFPNGDIDNSFNSGDGFNGQVSALAIQSDQKIIAVGTFTKYNGSAVNASRIVRILPNGARDPDFNIGLGADSFIESLVLQKDGKILLGGRFKTFNNIPFAGLVRLNQDGSIDESFNIGVGFDKYVFAIALQSNQKIIVGGSFLTFNEVSQKRIVRLNNDGSLDDTFDSGSGFNKGDVRAILVQPDDRIWVGGTFSGTYNAISSSRLIRLSSSGIFDNSFIAPLNNALYAMNFNEDYKLIIGGNFNSVSGKSKHRIARLKFCINTTTWNGTSWSNGFPSAGKEVYFKENFPNLTTTNICGCNIEEGKTVTLLENNTLVIEFAYTGKGILVVENAASLYQDDDDIVNTGIVHVKRKTKPVIRFDLTYWSSPVADMKLCDFSPETYFDKYLWFDPILGWKTNLYGTFTMDPGHGYSVRAPQSFSNSERGILEGVFKGIPNNGKLKVEFIAPERYYFVGNPYPCAINADDFLRSNAPKTKGTLYFWTHNTPPRITIPGTNTARYSNDDYAVYNLLGGVGTSSALNSGISNDAPDGLIASGQGFFVKSNQTGYLEFNNSMRVRDRNTSFFRPAPNSEVKSINEKYRFWLNIRNNGNEFKQILLGYATEASNSFDLMYDAEYLSSGTAVDFYSIIEDKKLVIQGRELPFSENDSISLGYKTTINDSFKVEIDHQDDFFNDKPIFLVDKNLNLVHNLSEGPYQFTSEVGTFHNRFSIIYNDKTLGNTTFKDNSNDVLISAKNHIINIESTKENISEIIIFDVLGNQIFKEDKLETKKIAVQNLISSHQVLFVKVIFGNGKSNSKKVIF